jgi:hypothetical protein
LKHDRWTETGREFIRQSTGRRVWQGQIGQSNVSTGPGKFDFEPFIRDDAKNEYHFGDGTHIKLTEKGVELRNRQKLINTVAFHPEVKKGNAWTREPAAVSSLRRVELDNMEDLPENHNLFAKEIFSVRKVQVSYDIESASQKSTIDIMIGGRRNVTIGQRLKNTSPKKGRHRLAMVTDITEAGELYPTNELIDRRKRVPGLGKHDRNYPIPFEYKFSEMSFSWLDYEWPDHNPKTVRGNFEIAIKEMDLESGDEVQIVPITWGPTNVGTDGYDWGTLWYDNNYLEAGDWMGTNNHTGMEWTNVTAYNQADDGTHIDIYFVGHLDSDESSALTTLYACDDETFNTTAATFGTGGSNIQPNNCAVHSTGLNWDGETTTGAYVECPDTFENVIQARFDGDGSAAAHSSGDDIGIVWRDRSSPDNAWYKVQSNTGNSPTMTIEYTTTPSALTVNVSETMNATEALD